MKAVLFDLDGVITSERIYWNCSGLAFAKYVGKDIPNDLEGKVGIAREMLGDETIRGFKEAGINSNWDITYTISVLNDLGIGVGEFLRELHGRGIKGLEYLRLLDELDPSKKHDKEGDGWKKAHKDFQACYYELKDTDEPVIALEKIKSAFDYLKGMGLKLGIVTGRPYEETEIPLKEWGLWEYFEPKLIVTQTEIDEEDKKRGEHLEKPNPYPILRAIFMHEGCEPCEKEKIAGRYVFVGDSVADVLAAKNAGIPVICVRTGLASEESLRKAGADAMVDDVGKVPEEIKKLFSPSTSA